MTKHYMFRLPMYVVAIFKASMNSVMRFELGEKFSHIRSIFNVELANYKHDEKELDEAVIYYNKALRLNVNNFYAYAGLGAAFLKMKLLKEAISYSNKAIGIKEHPLTYIVLYIAYDLSGDKDNAAKTKDCILKYYERNTAAAYNELSCGYLYLNEYARAAQFCQEAIKLDPHQYGLYLNLGKIYLAQNSYEDAVTAFQKVIELSNNKKYTKYAEEEIERIRNLSA